MQLSAIDMNLLVALDALLAEGSVTRAAARVGLSPSAMSHALARLRKLLDDPILLRSRSGLSPTPRARTLQPELREALDRIRVALAASPAFDPASSNQTFSVSCQDVTQILLIPRLLRLFETLAPGARLDVWPLAPRGQVPHDLEQGTYDVAIGQFPEVPRAIRTEVLFEDPIACLVRRDHPRIRSELTREQYAAERHLAVASLATWSSRSRSIGCSSRSASSAGSSRVCGVSWSLRSSSHTPTWSALPPRSSLVRWLPISASGSCRCRSIFRPSRSISCGIVGCSTTPRTRGSGP
jgi:DNA-binding transcriptional LysR family regulator